MARGEPHDGDGCNHEDEGPDHADRSAAAYLSELAAADERPHDHGDGESTDQEHELVRTNHDADRSPDQRIEVAAVEPGEHQGHAVGREAQREQHGRFLAHVRRPEEDGGKQEDEPNVEPAIDTGEGHGEGLVEEDGPHEGDPRRDEEGRELVRADQGHDEPAVERDRTTVDEAMPDRGASEREVTGPQVVREDRALLVVEVEVGHPVVEVVHHEDLERGAEEMEEDTGRHHVAQQGVRVAGRHAPRDDQAEPKHGGEDHDGEGQVRPDGARVHVVPSRGRRHRRTVPFTAPTGPSRRPRADGRGPQVQVEVGHERRQQSDVRCVDVGQPAADVAIERYQSA